MEKIRVKNEDQLRFWHSEDDRPYEQGEGPFSQKEIEEFTKEVCMALLSESTGDGKKNKL